MYRYIIMLNFLNNVRDLLSIYLIQFIKQQHFSTRRQMIKIQSGFYYCVDQQSTSGNKPEEKKVQAPKNQAISLEVVGNIKGYIQHVATQVSRIKQLKAKQKLEQLSDKLILDQLTPTHTNIDTQKQAIRLQIAVPPEIYEFDQRITKLEQKIINDQIVRQKIQRKGKLAERAKLLNMQIQKLLEKPDLINVNITNYCKNLEEKEEQSKALFLYEAFTKTQSLTEQIQMLDIYLKNLNEIMMKFKALVPHKAIVENHEKILEKREKNRERIRKLHEYMRVQYQKIVKQIDSL